MGFWLHTESGIYRFRQLWGSIPGSVFPYSICEFHRVYAGDGSGPDAARPAYSAVYQQHQPLPNWIPCAVLSAGYHVLGHCLPGFQICV